MGGVRPCTVEDLEGIAILHQKTFRSNADMPVVDIGYLVDHYSKLVFRNPWANAAMPSVVYEAPSGEIAGFFGVIPRPMEIRGRKVVGAMSTRLVVDPEHRSPFAAVELLKAYLEGPQDFSYTDGATSLARRLWQLLGGVLVPHLSMKWVHILRPSQLAASESVVGLPDWLIRAFCAPVDAAASAFVPFRVTSPGACTRPLSLDELGTGLADAAAHRALQPVYNATELVWLLDFLSDDPERGPLHKTGLIDTEGRVIGWHLMFAGQGEVAELVNIGAVRGGFSDVLQHAIYQAKDLGATAIQGRLDQSRLAEYWDNDCFVKQGGWTLVHTRDDEILRAVIEGDAYLQGLEGETAFPLQRAPSGRRR